MKTLDDIKRETQSVINKVCIAIMSFQPWELINILDNTKTYQDVSLLEFVEIVQEKLNDFKDLGDSQLVLDLDVCNGCKCKEPVVVFRGNVSDQEYAIYFEFEDHKIIDIFECEWYGEKELF